MKNRLLQTVSFVLSMVPFAASGTPVGAVAQVTENPWDAAQRDNNATAYTKFIIENPDSPLAGEAAIRIATLSAGVGLRPLPQENPADYLGLNQVEKFGDARLMNI